MRSLPGCGTVQDPPRAAVPPARGGIGPSSAAGVGRPRGGFRFHSVWAYGADRTEHLSRRASASSDGAAVSNAASGLNVWGRREALWDRGFGCGNRFCPTRSGPCAEADAIGAEHVSRHRGEPVAETYPARMLAAPPFFLASWT